MAIRKNGPQLKQFYADMRRRVDGARQQFGPLTFAQKILYNHLASPNFTDEDGNPLSRGVSYANLSIDHVAMQDATAQMVFLQFDALGLPAQVPATVHLDHLITAREGAKQDLLVALDKNAAVYDFIHSGAERFGIGLSEAGDAIIHQFLAENIVFPGMTMVGTDSHTPNGGGLGALAMGVGGADALDPLAGQPLNVLWPKLIGVRLTGELNGWVAPKDVIIRLVQMLTVQGGTNSVVEFFGPGLASLSAGGRMTICNMGAEHGATGSVFPYDSNTAAYLRATNREEWALLADRELDLLNADPEVLEDPEHYFDRVLDINLSDLSPNISGPGSPDNVRTIAELCAAPPEITSISMAFIGSCTNSSYEDMTRAASVLKAGLDRGLSLRVPLFINCGSSSIYDTIEADGILDIFQRAGAKVMANACGACIGQLTRDDGLAGKPNAIVSSFNRNFPGRNDGSKETLSYLLSPEMVCALAFAGVLPFDPVNDPVPGTDIRLPVPEMAFLPKNGLRMNTTRFVEPGENPMQTPLRIPASSDRLAALKPFPAWNGSDFLDLPILVFVDGKCTTDDISAGGAWLEKRGHLEKISGNTYMRVKNPHTGKDNDALNILNGGRGSYHDVATDYRDNGLGWVVFGRCGNFGEGSSREHAALQPRFLGCKAILIDGAFARIHQTNLKKQGILPLVVSDSRVWELAKEGARVSIYGLNELAPGQNLKSSLTMSTGSSYFFEVSHSLSQQQIEWFRAGSFLNYVREQMAAKAAV